MKRSNTSTQTRTRKQIMLLLLLILVVLSLDIYMRLKTQSLPVEEKVEKLDLSSDPLNLEGYVPVDISTIQNALVLTKSCKSIAMSTNEIQAYSIQQGQSSKINFRPLTHDIIKGILDNYEIKLLMVKINAIDKDLYSANLYLKQGDKLLNLEARPSDAVAIAVREDSPVYLREDLLDSYGQASC